MPSSTDRSLRRITQSAPSRCAMKTASRISRSPLPTKPWHGPTRSRGGSETSGGIWPPRERLARGSRTRRTATSCSETSSRFDPVCVVEFLIPFRHESGLLDAPHPRGPPPIRRRTHDLERLLERRGVEDERLELPAFPARVDAPRLLQAEEISDDAISSACRRRGASTRAGKAG